FRAPSRSPALFSTTTADRACRTAQRPRMESEPLRTAPCSPPSRVIPPKTRMSGGALKRISERIWNAVPIADDERLSYALRVVLLLKLCFWHFLRGSDFAQLANKPWTAGAALTASVVGTALACTHRRA